MDTDAIDLPLDLGYSPIYSPLGPATPTSPSHEGRPLTFNDATSYLETVDKFQDNIDVYDRFLDIMFTANSQTHVIPTTPPTDLTQNDTQPMKDFNKTVDYVHRIKQRFASDPDTYIEFLELLQRYQKEQMSISVVYRRVHVLFKGQLDLLEEFQKMLPADHNGNQGNTSGQLAGGNGALLDSTDQIQPASSNRVPMKDNSTERKGVDDDRMSLVGSLHRLEDIPNQHLTILQKRQASEDPEIRRWEPHPAALPAVRSKPELGTINLPLLFSVSATQLTAPPHKRARTDSGVEVHSAQVTPSTPRPGGQSAKVEDSILPIREARNARSREMTASGMFECLVEHGCLDLRTSIDPNSFSSHRVAEGGFGDVWKGTMTGGLNVAIKVLRYGLVRGDEPKNIKRAMREIYNWSKLEHKNIHKLLGVTMFQERLGMVSTWMDHGTLKQYLDRRTDLDRHKLCFQIAEGVMYLHSVNLVHGDLKACNILVSSDGTLKLTDFDYSIISGYSVEFSATTRGSGGTLRWMAPELVIDDDPIERSKHTDVYALGMTFLETITNTLPYSECPRDGQIYGKLARREHPKRLMEYFPLNRLGNSIWELLVECWNYDPSSRPTADQILVILKAEIGHTN